MKIGNYRFGNDYKFDENAVKLRPGEKRDDLNKVELRYGVRKDQPHYPSIKALHRWRSVFGYHLGGVLRQVAVKVADIKRPLMNTVNLVKSIAGDGLHTYQRLYSARDCMAGMKATNPGGSVSMLRYVSFQQIPEKIHQYAADNDRTPRNFVMSKLMGISSNAAIIRELENANRIIEIKNEIGREKDPFNFEPTPLHDIAATKRELANAKSGSAIRWEKTRQEIRYKAHNQFERLKDFFQNIKPMGLKQAYERLCDNAHRDEVHFQRKFRFNFDNEPDRHAPQGNQVNPQPNQQPPGVVAQVDRNNAPQDDHRNWEIVQIEMDGPRQDDRN